MKEPIEWQNYDQSTLPHLLRHDTWRPHLGLSLLSGIDHRNSELCDPIMYYNIPYDEIGFFQKETGLYFDDQEYWKIQLLADRPNNARRTYYADVDQYMDACHEWEVTCEQLNDIDCQFEFKPLDELLIDHFAAQKMLNSIIDIFRSNPIHNAEFVTSPSYYIQWAKDKKLHVQWLEWAESRGYLVQGAGNTQPERKPSSAAPGKKISGTRKAEKEQEIAELRKAANQVAIKLKIGGIDRKHITVERICKDLLKEHFSDGKLFTSRWGTVDGMRSYLKGEHNPTRTEEFRKAKSNRGNFNQ